MKQFHVLARGFELNKTGKDNSSRTTELRHYRYDMDSHTCIAENGAWVIKMGKELKAAFPVANTMILVEEVEEKERQ
jgi:hypothetical protein